MTGQSNPKRASVNPIFGDEQPMSSRDERDEGASQGDAEREQWLRDNVPPHHG